MKKHFSFSPLFNSENRRTSLRHDIGQKLCLFGAAFLIFAGNISAQLNADKSIRQQAKTTSKSEQNEELARYFVTGVHQMQAKTGISDMEFVHVMRFYVKQLDSEKLDFMQQIRAGKITLANIDEYQDKVTNHWVERYARFEQIKKEFPSSVAEYVQAPPRPMIACTPACNNIDFGQGTLNGWYAYYGNNNSDFAPCNSACFDINDVTGGLQGPVYYMNPIDPLTNSYQVHITTGPGKDALNPARPTPVVSPWATSKYSCMIGDSTGTSYGAAILEQKFLVGPSNANFSYSYALFIENPAHPYYDQPFFRVAVLDSNNDTIPNCGSYNVVSGDLQDSLVPFIHGDQWYQKYWTIVAVPLKKYIGQCVTVIFEIADCGYGGHAAYAYVDCSCSPLGLISSSPAFCGQKTITLTAPPGERHYLWSGPPNGIVGQDSLQTITIDSSGVYQVIMTPITGSKCNDTLKITVPKKPGPPPIAFFHADTVCVGDSTYFKNASTSPGSPWTGCKFYWDFYNIGHWDDTVHINPYWTYPGPGIYKVKLGELYNGCGSDTILQIKVDSAVTGSFTANPATQCAGQPISFTNNTQGGKTYEWYFDDPLSGPQDSTNVMNPSHTFNFPGTYTVTLVAKNSGNCNETVTQVVTIKPRPHPAISGIDSICPGGNTNLTASSGYISYTWSNGGTTSSINVNPLSPTCYTVTVDNGTCTGDTTFCVYIKPLPVPIINSIPATDSICLGDSAKLTGSGGGTYAWSTPPGGTNQTVKVVNGTYTLAVTKDGCTHDTTITIAYRWNKVPTIGRSTNNVCPNDTITLSASGGLTYLWGNGSTNSSRNVDPGIDSVYHCRITTPCRIIDTTIAVKYKPWPTVNIWGDTGICLGNTATLNVSQGTYLWGGGQTNPTIIVAPVKDSVFTVAVTLNGCTKDTSIQVNVHKTPHTVITPDNKICLGKSFTISASGACHYIWSNGATTSSITISPGSTTTYTVKAWCYYDTTGCDTTLSSRIIVDVAKLYACCSDTIVAGDTVAFSANGSSNYEWTPNFGLSCDNCPFPVATPSVTTTYTVTSIDTLNGCVRDTLITVLVRRPCNNLYVPNVFTPNNDGINDDFVVSVDTLYPTGERSSFLNFTFYNITIFDRWGKQVFSSYDPTVPWNGRMQNTQNLVPDGVYYYVIRTTCGGNNGEQKGFVHVMGEQ